jgi:hypothetical protein
LAQRFRSSIDAILGALILFDTCPLSLTPFFTDPAVVIMSFGEISMIFGFARYSGDTALRVIHL